MIVWFGLQGGLNQKSHCIHVKTKFKMDRLVYSSVLNIASSTQCISYEINILIWRNCFTTVVVL